MRFSTWSCVYTVHNKHKSRIQQQDLDPTFICELNAITRLIKTQRRMQRSLPYILLAVIKERFEVQRALTCSQFWQIPSNSNVVTLCSKLPYQLCYHSATVSVLHVRSEDSKWPHSTPVRLLFKVFRVPKQLARISSFFSLSLSEWAYDMDSKIPKLNAWYLKSKISEYWASKINRRWGWETDNTGIHAKKCER